eukprot:scaffold226591_cov36-Tisochrysis_lutea.AAC.3
MDLPFGPLDSIPRVLCRWRSEGVRSGDSETSRSASNQFDLAVSTRAGLGMDFSDGEQLFIGLHSRDGVDFGILDVEETSKQAST